MAPSPPNPGETSWRLPENPQTFEGGNAFPSERNFVEITRVYREDYPSCESINSMAAIVKAVLFTSAGGLDLYTIMNMMLLAILLLVFLLTSVQVPLTAGHSVAGLSPYALSQAEQQV
ncbi:hypothetical protein Ancab_036417 [Ancistrocladus abbreviatus]